MHAKLWTPLFAALLLTAAGEICAQPAGFTYQGQLKDGSGAVDGQFEFRFALYASPAAGEPLASVTLPSLAVSNALFTAELDFGTAAFDGSERWLEIAVRRTGSTNSPTTLSPRQHLAATPYAIRAATVPDASITAPKLTPGAVTAASITNGAVGPAQLAPGAALQNLLAAGQSPVPSGGMLLSSNPADPALLAAGFQILGPVALGGLWRPCPADAAPSPRAYHTAVWTGTEMLVWGGMYWDGGIRTLATGARYNPLTGVWQPISTNGAPSARHLHTAIWTGTEMIIWGGQTGGGATATWLNDGACYRPADDAWQSISAPAPMAGRCYHTAVWDGMEMLIWGGRSGTSPTYIHYADGARYRPATGDWLPISLAGSPAARSEHTAVWTGTEMLIWGGTASSQPLQGGRYRPASDTWLPLSTANSIAPTFGHTAIWTGREMLAWGGLGSESNPTAGAYQPEADAGNGGWTSLAAAGGVSPAGRAWHTATWTGSEMIIWGGSNFYQTAARYSPTEKRWLDVTADGAPAGRYGHSAVWTGTQMIIWGGLGNGADLYLADGSAYTPSRFVYLYRRD